MPLYDAKHRVFHVPPLPRNLVSNNNDETIIIVGAGAAGLFAAYTLEYLGMTNYQVLEASSMIGGRAQKTNNLSSDDEFDLDLGAEWLHYNVNIMKDLLLFDDHDDIPETVPFSPKTAQFQQPDGRMANRNFLQHLYQEYKFKSGSWARYLEEYVYAKVKDRVALNTPVTAIDYDSNEGQVVKVTTTCQQKGTVVHTARKVIVTVPLGVMKAGLIEFNPPLPVGHQEAIEQATCAGGFKVFLEFQQRFYTDVSSPRTGWKLVVDGETDLLVFYDAVMHKNTSKAIMGCACIATKAEGLDLVKMTEEDLIPHLLKKLDSMFDGQATTNYIRHAMVNWSNMPYIQCAYSMDEHPKLEMGMPVKDCIFFAGEHLSAKYPGYLPGAAIEGRQAAVMALGGTPTDMNEKKCGFLPF